ncbi:MAG: NUDIX hydrolase [Chitinophagaceae bacterium]
MEDLEWKVLSSEQLFQEPWLDVKKDRCLTPQGKVVDPYYVLSYPNWVNALALSMDNEVILVRQYRHGMGKTILELPGGCMDIIDLSPMAAVQRELLEETGYAFDHISEVCQISPNPSTQNNICFGFLATGGKKIQEQKLDPNEEIEVILISMDELKKMLKNNQFWQAMHVTTIFYYFEKMGIMQISK